jgi:hypothetical protein
VTDPCKQEGTLGGINSTLEAVEHTLDKLERGQERFIGILEAMSAQGVKILKAETDIEMLYARMRRSELEAVEQKTKMTWLVGIASAVVSAVTAFITGHIK